MSKPKVAFFDFASCEGCQLQVLNCEEEFLDLLGLIDIVNFREAMTEASWDIDVAFVEGSITREGDEARLKKIRESSKLVIAIGACSNTGGINAIKNNSNLLDVRSYVYGDKKEWYPTYASRPIDQVVKVDGYVPGCPIDRSDFIKTVQNLLVGKAPPNHNFPVCLECRLKENECLLTLGKPCMGPITRGGCDAIEPTFGAPCIGCRGFIDEANMDSAKEMLKAHNLTVDDVKNFFTIFNSFKKEGSNA